MHWTTKDGRKIDIKDMSDSHLRNAIAMLRRNGIVGADELKIGSAYSMQWEMAQYYAEQTVADMAPSRLLDEMEHELALRSNDTGNGPRQAALAEGPR